jgi:AcrR family transcriptional regulator
VTETVVPGRSARREALLDAADRIVRRDGPAASMATIAAEAGITKPILYRHFGDKTGLYAALADRYTTRLMADLQQALGDAATPVERTARTIDAYLRTIEAEPQVYRFLVRSGEAAEEGSQVRSFSRRVSALLTVWMGAELGLPPEDVRVQTRAHGVVGMVQAAGDWWLDTRTCPRADLVAALVDLLTGADGRAAVG